MKIKKRLGNPIFNTYWVKMVKRFAALFPVVQLDYFVWTR